MPLRKFVLAAVFLFGVAAVPAFAQRPPNLRINFTASSAFKLEKSHFVLPAGKYVLFQLDANNRDVFALYRGDMMHSPVAILRTARLYYLVGQLPQKTRVLMETDEASPELYPTLQGWQINGDDGWEIVSMSISPKAQSSRTHAAQPQKGRNTGGGGN